MEPSGIADLRIDPNPLILPLQNHRHAVMKLAELFNGSRRNYSEAV